MPEDSIAVMYPIVKQISVYIVPVVRVSKSAIAFEIYVSANSFHLAVLNKCTPVSHGTGVKE